MKQYLTSNQLKHDLPASLAVFLVAIPLCLGIAHASGAPLIAGLIAGALGGLVIGPISKSQLSVSGPAAGLATIVLAYIKELQSYDLFLVAVCLAGIIQLIFGALKLGVVGNYIPNNVIKGMLTAIGVMLIIKQLPHVLGYDIEEMGVEEFAVTNEDLNNTYHDKKSEESNSFTILAHSILNIGAAKKALLIIGLISLVLLVVWDKYIAAKIKTIPGSLVVVVVGIGLNLILSAIPHFDLDTDHLVSIPVIRSVSDFHIHSIFPDWKALTNPLIYKVAFVLAFIASLETLLSIEAVDNIDPQGRRTPPNRELVAQGVGNIASGLLGGLPLTSVIVRGSVNIAAGARTKASAILHGLFIILSIVFFTRVINMIPLASLASILVYTGYKLINPKGIVAYYKKGWSQFLPFIITIVAVVFTDLLIGVIVGLLVAALFIVRNNYNSPILKVNNMGKRIRISLGENVSFLHKNRLLKEFAKIKPNSVLEIDASRSLFIDQDVVDSIIHFQKECIQKNIRLILGGIHMNNNRKETLEFMKASYERLLQGNRNWVEEKTKNDPEYFARQVEGQAPEYLFIGCSDSRVPANEITGTEPGEMFVHRNIANLVVNTDVNLMSVVQYSVEVLNVKHIIVCGHYGCGGVKAAMETAPHGLIDKWLRNIKDVHRLHLDEVNAIKDPELRLRRMVELNVREQTYNLMKTSFIQKNRNQYGFPDLHGWVYDISNGVVIDLKIQEETEFQEYDQIYKLY